MIKTLDFSTYNVIIRLNQIIAWKISIASLQRKNVVLAWFDNKHETRFQDLYL